MELVPVRTTRATSASTLAAAAAPSRSRRNRSKKSSTSTTAPSWSNSRRRSAMMVETSSTVTTTATTDGGDGDSDAGDDYGPPHVDDYCDYGSPKEELKSECIDLYYDPLREDTKLGLGDDDGDAVIVNDCYDFDPPEEEPELVATSDDTDDDGGPDFGYDCSHCGISLGSRKFKVAHELRCKVQRQQREFESKITKLYHCGYCKCPFVEEEHKEQHQQKYCRKKPMAKRRESNDPFFGCDKCKFVTKWKSSLETHFLTHDKNNAAWFTCTQCSYKTVYKNAMTRHTKIHDNTFSYCCPICGKSFRRKWTLDDHLLRQHFDEPEEVAKLITSKVYSCNICDQFRTTLKNDFNIHITVTHLKGVGCEKYECPRCPYSTFHKGNLRKHSKTHEEQKEYRCTICKKQFAQKMQLHSHMLHIHADNVDLIKTITTKVHRCESCSFKTVKKSRLERHVRSKHT